MLDFDAGKLLIIGLVALVVIGPKDLPRVLRQVGQAVGKLRRMAGEFQGQFMDAMKEADLQDIKAEIAKLKDSATLDVDFDPAREIKNELTSAVSDPVPAVSVPPVESLPAEGAVALADAPAIAAEPHDLVLPPPSEIVPETTVAATGIGPVADFGPVPEPVATTLATDLVDHPTGAISLPDPAVSTPAIEREPESPTTRRKIVVTRRRRLSRLDGPTLRAATLTGRSRNILPARRDTKDQ